MAIKLRTYDEIKNDLQMWGKTAREQDALLHILAVQTILHAETHGDCSLVGAMFDVLPPSFKVRYLNRWVNEYTPIVFSNSKKGEDKVWRLARKDEEAYKPFDIEGANANPFYVSIPKEQIEDLSMGVIVAEIKRSIDKLKKAISNGTFKGDAEAALKFAGKIDPALTMGAQIVAAEDAA